MGNREFDADLEAAVRRYVSAQFLRYMPVAVALLLVLAMIMRAPSVSQPDGDGSGDLAAGSGEDAGFAGESGDGSTGVGAGSDGAGGSATGGGAAGGGASGGGSGGGEGAAGSAGGVAKTGVTCGPGVRQFDWSKYAPPCRPAFKGDNGGNTSPGVTKDTITITYRQVENASQAAINAASPNTFAPDEDVIADMQRYIDLFNKTFELYGRKVVLKPFRGQSDFLLEVQGQNQGPAQADAVRAREAGAFGDMSLNSASQLYQEGLAQQKVVAFGGIYMSQKWFQDHSPYAYSSFYPTGTNVAYGTSNVVCRRTAGLPAIDAGDPVYQKTTRVYGVITPENPVYDDSGDLMERELQKCGVKVARSIRYALNIATAQQQSASIVAQLKAAGVTTVLCGCDPIGPVFMAQAANQQDYRPEWATLWWGDLSPRSIDASQWSHSVSLGSVGQITPKNQQEAYQAIKKAGAEPAEVNYPVAYYSLLQLFMGLHAAGPNLTPQTFQRGLFALPPTGAGDMGVWRFGDGAFTPHSDFLLAFWSPSARSEFDGQSGAYVNCEGGKRYRYRSPDDLGGKGQLRCFGR